MKTKIKLLALDVDGTMTDGGIYVMEDGRQFKKFNAKDGMGIKIAIKSGIQVGIISHSLRTEMVSSRANSLGLKYFYVGQADKLITLKEWQNELQISSNEIAFIGDDVNDLEVMQYVGISACPSDAVAQIKEIATIKLGAKGGEGAVREFIDSYLLD